MIQINKKFILVAIFIIIAFLLGYKFGIGNQKPKYGSSGYPKNCRALITDNLRGFENHSYTAEEALYSIERNCGPSGYIWNER